MPAQRMARPNTHLYVLLIQQPRPVREDFVDVVDGPQLGRYVVQPLQPIRVAALLQELFLVIIY